MVHCRLRFQAFVDLEVAAKSVVIKDEAKWTGKRGWNYQSKVRRAYSLYYLLFAVPDFFYQTLPLVFCFIRSTLLQSFDPVSSDCCARNAQSDPHYRDSS
jgi:hypothetical protein